MANSSKSETAQVSGNQVDTLFLPAGAIRGMGRYLNTGGCKLSVVVEDLEGRKIRRYIANDRLILYSEDAESHDKVNDLQSSDPDTKSRQAKA
jgi:hypothetical protein